MEAWVIGAPVEAVVDVYEAVVDFPRQTLLFRRLPVLTSHRS